MAINKPTIIIVDNSYYYTGAFKAILSSVVALSDSYEFVFVFPRKTRIANMVRDNKFKVKTLPFIELSRRPKDVLYYLPVLLINGFALARLVLLYNARIIHVNDFYNLVGTIAKLMVPSVKLVTHIRKLPDSFPFILSCFWLRVHKKFSNQIICVSKAVQNQLRNDYSAILIYDGIQEQEKHLPRKSFAQNLTGVRLLYLGHFIPGKGQDYALESFKIVQKNYKNIRLRFVGGDMGIRKNIEFKKSLQKKAENWGIDNLIEFKEFTSDVEREIKEADIVLNFSESESYSFTCLETLYYGTPLIATDSGGPAELFENKHSGHLVPNRNVNSMVKAILELSSDPKLMQKYSRNSRDYIRKNYKFSTSLMEISHIYNKLLNSKD